MVTLDDVEIPSQVQVQKLPTQSAESVSDIKYGPKLSEFVR